MEHKIVIQRHRPWLRAGLIVLATSLLAGGAWALYAYTRATTVSDFSRAQLEVEQLRDTRRQLSRELRAAQVEAAQLRDQLVYVERSRDIDKQACESVRGSLGQIQAEVADLREQLAFYRGIVSPDLSRAGVRVHDFKIQALEAANRYRYDLVLIQSVRHDRRIDGRVEISVEGLMRNAPKTLSFSEMTSRGAANLVFSFKYFEEFSGELTLPDGFRPQRIRIRLVPQASGAPPVEDQFDWTKSFSG
ncbi:MAG: DUF6776 family protein [Gammaproteobacteria bacterium]|jgi:outer membrane murein-binding lipoprotein Lpp